MTLQINTIGDGLKHSNSLFMERKKNSPLEKYLLTSMDNACQKYLYRFGFTPKSIKSI
jgi:hypothetical protein